MLSRGNALSDDAGDGDLYFSEAYGTAVVDLAPKDAPYAMGTVTATIQWATNRVGPRPDAGAADGGDDASPDGSSDALADGSQKISHKCGVMLSGATTTTGDAGLPCTSSLLYTPEQGFSTLTITETSDGGDTTQIAIVLPGIPPASIESGRSSATDCSGTCSASVSIVDGTGDATQSWVRSWSASDIGTVPWFNVEFTTYGTCPVTGITDYQPCAGYTGSFTATLPADTDGGPPGDHLDSLLLTRLWPVLAQAGEQMRGPVLLPTPFPNSPSISAARQLWDGTCSSASSASLEIQQVFLRSASQRPSTSRSEILAHR